MNAAPYAPAEPTSFTVEQALAHARTLRPYSYTCLYLFDDADGVALYAGQTSQWRTRLFRHRASSTWFPEVARVLLLPTSRCRSFRQADEQMLIAQKAPRFNKQHRIPRPYAAALFWTPADLSMERKLQGPIPPQPSTP